MTEPTTGPAPATAAGPTLSAAPAPMPLLQRLATPVQVVMTLGMYLELSLLGGLAAAPGIGLLAWTAGRSAAWPPWLRAPALGVALFLGYFSYALCVILVTGAFRAVTRMGTPLGCFSYYSPQGLQRAS